MLSIKSYFENKKGKKWMQIQRALSRAVKEQKAGRWLAAVRAYFEAARLFSRAILIELDVIFPARWEESRMGQRNVLPEKYFLINHQSRIIYCPIPKVASSTLIRQLILKNNLDVNIERIKRTHEDSQNYYALDTYSYERACELLQDNRYLKCVFVRNPWSRLTSAYLMFLVKQGSIVSKIFLTAYYKSKEQVPNYKKSVTFRQFIEYITICDEKELDPHWQPQYLFLGNQVFDFIGKFENLAADFEHLKQLLHLPNLEIITVNGSPYSTQPIQSKCHFSDYYPSELKELNGFPDYKAFYTPELKARVERYYQKDIAMFDYSFDN